MAHHNLTVVNSISWFFSGFHQILDQSLGRMALEDWKDFVSATATITTIINFLSGIAVGFFGYKFILSTLLTFRWLEDLSGKAQRERLPVCHL